MSKNGRLLGRAQGVVGAGRERDGPGHLRPLVELGAF